MRVVGAYIGSAGRGEAMIRLKATALEAPECILAHTIKASTMWGSPNGVDGWPCRCGACMECLGIMMM